MDQLEKDINPIALGAFRIALAALLFVDLATRAVDVEAHYTNSGAFPLPFGFLHSLLEMGRVDVFLLLDSLIFHQLLFGVGLLAAICFGLGVATRPAQVVVWLVLLGAQNRNPLLNGGADIYVRVVLFWCFFLPLGQRLRLRIGGRGRTVGRRLSSRVAVPGLWAYSIQLGIVYFCSFFVKWNTPYWASGDAVQLALRIDSVRGPLAGALSSLPGVLAFLTYGTLIVQLAAAVFLLLPPHVVCRARRLVLGLLMAMHVGIIATFSVGLFPYYAIVSLIPFLPCRRAPARSGKDSAMLRHKHPKGGLGAGLPGFSKRVKVAAIAVALVYVLLHLLVYYGWLAFPGREAQKWLDRFGRITGLHQHWVMFSGIEYNPRGRVVGYRSDGSARTLFEIPGISESSRPPDRQAPPPYEYSAIYETYRWKKFFLGVLRQDNPDLFKNLSRFLCRDTDGRSGPGHFSRIGYAFWHEKLNWKTGRTELDDHYEVTNRCPAARAPGDERATSPDSGR